MGFACGGICGRLLEGSGLKDALEGSRFVKGLMSISFIISWTEVVVVVSLIGV